jgi:hypothetical protein
MNIENSIMISNVFYCDGSYRDIYIRNTSISDWNVFLEFIKREQLQLEMYKDGVRIEFDNLSIEEIFNLTKQFAIRLIIYLDTVSIHCNFFTVEEIELDIDPKEVTNNCLYDRVIGFLLKLSNAVNKEVVLTPENCPDYVMLRSLPNQNGIEYVNVD